MFADDLRERGVNPWPAHSHDGVNTLTIENGRWRHRVAGREEYDCVGTYTVEGGRVTLVISPTCGGAPEGAFLIDASWAIDGDELWFTGMEDDFGRAVWGGHTWTRVG